MCPFNTVHHYWYLLAVKRLGTGVPQNSLEIKIRTEAEVDLLLQRLMIYAILLNLINLKNSWN